MEDERFTGTVGEFWIKYGNRFYYDLKDNTIKMKEDKKTLSDKIEPCWNTSCKEEILKLDDVKEALKEFINCFTNGHNKDIDFVSLVNTKAKEIFGERLI